MEKRRELRLKKYDYSKCGIYFITIVTNYRKRMFGEIVNGEVALNLAGEMVLTELEKLTTRFEGTKLGAVVVMPNHLHFILEIQDRENDVKLSDLICAFKSISTLRYIKGVRHESWTAFDKRLWQRGYYEHIVRNQTSLNQIIEYINNNPKHWGQDPENPEVR